MARDLLSYVPALLMWAAVLYKFPRRRPPEPGARFLWLTLLGLALAMTVLLPPVYQIVDRLVGVPNLARLLGNGLVLVAGWTAQAYLFHLNYSAERARPAIRRNGCLLLVTLIGTSILFSLARVDEEALDFQNRFAGEPFIMEYRLLYLAYLGLTLAYVVPLSWRYAGISPRPALSLGLRLVAAGGIVGCGYVIHEALLVLTRRLGVAYPVRDSALLTEVLIAVSATLLVVGSTLPSWGPRVGVPALYRWAERYRTCRRLYPLWRALCEANPGIALVPPMPVWRDALIVRDLGFRLYRRVVEIHDGRLELRRYMDQRAVDYAHEQCRERGLDDQETAITVHAASLACALQAQAQGREARRPAANLPGPATADIATEATFLARVADCYERSPLVRAVVAHVEREQVEAATHEARRAGQG
jgi:hypothetical protein